MRSSEVLAGESEGEKGGKGIVLFLKVHFRETPHFSSAEPPKEHKDVAHTLDVKPSRKLRRSRSRRGSFNREGVSFRSLKNLVKSDERVERLCRNLI